MRVDDKYHMTCTKVVPCLSVALDKYKFTDDFYVIELANTNVSREYYGYTRWEDS